MSHLQELQQQQFVQLARDVHWSLRIDQKMMKPLHILVLLCLFRSAVEADCVFNSSNYFMNCKQYCQIYFADPPQRVYYNVTSQNCEPQRLCSPLGYYDYTTNQCYNEPLMKSIAPSTIPELYQIVISMIPAAEAKMICVNGVVVPVSINNIICACNLLWKDSNLVDMNGYKFKCDKPITDLPGYFVPDLTFDAQGNITFYGPFTAQSMNQMIANVKAKAAANDLSYIYNVSDSILFSVKTGTVCETIIRSWEMPYFYGILACVYFLFAVSYFRYEQGMIQASYLEVRERVVQVLQNKEIIM